jgi:hypothetical protein
MSYYRTPKSIKAYNWFKFAGTLILLCTFVFLLLRVQHKAATAPIIVPITTATTPVAEPTSTIQPSPTPQPPTPTIAAPTPTTSATETESSVTGEPAVSSEASAPTPVPPQPPTLSAPASGALVAGNLVTLEGTGTPGTEIEILDQGKVISTTVVQLDGTWTLGCLCDSGARLLSVQNAGESESASEAIVIQVAVAPISIPDDLVCDEDEENIPMGTDHGTVYVVAPCEYIGLIADRAGVELADLLAANPQLEDPDRIEPGQILNLPPR